MIRLLQWLIFGHVHEWETIEERDLYDGDLRIRIGKNAYCKCKKCGAWKLFQLR